MPQSRSDARRQLRNPKRLSNIIISSEIECLYLVCFTAACRNNYYRNTAPLAHPLYYFHPVNIRKTKIEKYQLWPVRSKHLSCLHAVCRSQHCITAALKSCTYKAAYRFIILYHEYSSLVIITAAHNPVFPPF